MSAVLTAVAWLALDCTINQTVATFYYHNVANAVCMGIINFYPAAESRHILAQVDPSNPANLNQNTCTCSPLCVCVRPCLVQIHRAAPPSAPPRSCSGRKRESVTLNSVVSL